MSGTTGFESYNPYQLPYGYCLQTPNLGICSLVEQTDSDIKLTSIDPENYFNYQLVGPQHRHSAPSLRNRIYSINIGSNSQRLQKQHGDVVLSMDLPTRLFSFCINISVKDNTSDNLRIKKLTLGKLEFNAKHIDYSFNNAKDNLIATIPLFYIKNNIVLPKNELLKDNLNIYLVDNISKEEALFTKKITVGRASKRF